MKSKCDTLITKNLSYLSTEDYTQQHKTIYQLFEEQVEKTPHRIAVISDQIEITYQALNEKANQLAHYLKKLGVTIETPVGVLMERSTNLIISVLGILKSGGVCVPLNTTEPPERLASILEDTRLSLVLVDENQSNEAKRHLHSWKKWIKQLFSNKNGDKHNNLRSLARYVSLHEPEIQAESTQNIPLHSTSENLAFLVYTSGSTGNPKGVMLPHRVFSRCKFWAKNVFNFSPDDRFLFKSIRAPEELLFPLFIGASLTVLPPNAEKDAALFIKTIIKNDITVANFTPSFLEVLLDEFHIKQLACLKHVFCAGEMLSLALQNKFFSILTANLYNFYGLAESPYTSYWQCKPQHPVLIGKPVDTTVYILSPEHQNVPVGVVGELCISGVSLATGYLNQTELTAEKFIANPFEKNTRLYKTGDLARYLPDGNIEHLGRNDFQIKIRGYRVELGEIEQFLLQYPAIKQAVVVAKNNYLIAYYVAQKRLNENAIHQYLSKHLPSHMVPNVFMFLEKFPLNANSKLDRKALPHPELQKQKDYLAPQNKTEKILCMMCAEIFNLPASAISVKTDFFRLGGNSILAIQFAHRIGRKFNIYLSVAEIFRTKTLELLAQTIENITTKNILIRRAKRFRYYPLSFAQERLWFIEQYEQGTSAYHIPWLVKLSKNISLDALNLALKAIVKRHTILRTIFIQNKKGQDFQCIKSEALSIKIKCCETVDKFNRALQEEINMPFDLRQEYPIRGCIYEIIESSEQYLLINLHHIAADGWSTNILQKEFIMFYEYYYLGKSHSLPKLPVQYRDFAIWQRNFLSENELKKQLDYWHIHLKNYETLYLATDKPRPTRLSYEGDSVSFLLSHELSTQLRNFSQLYGYTLYTVFLAGFYVLLNQYSGQKDIIIGTPIANRHYESIKDLIGFFVNMLALREQVNVHQPITYLMQQIHENLTEAQRHQDVPFEKLVQALNVERDASRHPLFQVIFAVQSFGKQEELFGDYYQPVDISNLHNPTRYDVEFCIDDSQHDFQGKLIYSTSLFNKSTMQRWVEHYKNILTQMVNEPYKLLKDYRVFSASEYKQIMHDWNQTGQIFPHDKTIQQLFEEQVERTPHRIAMVYQDIKWTYQALNQKANQLAHYLRENYAIKGDDLIALCIERSDEMIISILGVLKSGGAYVPLDPEYPEERLRYMLSDTQPKAIIINTIFQYKLKNLQNNVILNSLKIRNVLNKQLLTNPFQITTSRHLAYVIYTSGTTGKPKGVMVEHRSVINTIFSLNTIYALNPGEKSAAFCNYVFDVSVSEIFCPLFKGAELHLLNDEIRKDSALISAYVQSYGIHYLYLPPVLLSMFPQLFHATLRGIIYAGETCDAATGNYWSNQCQLFNYYGPTETAIYALGKQVIDGDVHLIGKPINNTVAYVLNQYLNPVPIGVIGELYIGGLGLARGYLNAPELTAEKFISSPFNKNERLYKTGDLVRYLPDGNIEYISRNDCQVKIRGYRVEVAEIEQCLCRHPQIKQAIVVVQTHQQSSAYHYLIGYYVSDIPLDETAIINHLSNYLPDYMIPARLIFLEKLPLTINGKLDKKALPKPECKNEVIFIEPRSDEEKKLCHIFSEIFELPIEGVGIHSDFFHLGGNSIMAMQLAYQISSWINRHFPIIEIFRARTIEKLAHSIISPPRFFEIKDFIVLFRKKGTKKPIFMIPGGAGEENELLLFVSIAHNLKFDCPVYGIRSRVYDAHWNLPKTLREQAEIIFNSIRKIQPYGPYYFFGECIAGALAVELQYIAEEQGEGGGMVFLLNSHAPYNKEFNLASPELPPKLEAYYRLLFSGKPVKLHSELHLMLSSDEKSPDFLFEQWKQIFEKKSCLYSIPGTHFSYIEDSPFIAAVLDEVLS